MFCQKCGAPSDTRVCPNCAAKAQTQATPSTASAGILPIIKKNWHFVLAGLGVVLLIFGILNLFSVFEINLSLVDVDSEYVSVSDAEEFIELTDGTAAPIYIGNIFFGLSCLCAAAVGILYFLKVFMNKPFYDNAIFKRIIMGRKEKTPAGAMGGLMIGATLVQFILYMLCTLSRNGKIVVTFGINWTSWLLLGIFIAIAIFNKFVLSKVAE